MDAFHSYNNVLAFFIGNENIAKKEDSVAAPYLKAAARDMKAYRDRKGYRQIPIGYSAADIKELRPMLQDYLTCGGNATENVDFFGLNSYSWCGESNYKLATYNEIEDQAKNFPVPIFLTETGCIVPPNRLWEDQDAIFTKPMVDDWSGAIAYEWIQEENQYGIVVYDGPKAADGIARSGTPQPKQPDFDNLKSKWATNTPSGVSKSAYNTDKISTRACPSATSGGWWEVSGNVQVPALGQEYTGSYKTIASATATSAASSDATGTSSADGDKDGDSAASIGKHVTFVGSMLAGLVLGFTLLL